jgi:hypothetical protein
MQGTFRVQGRSAEDSESLRVGKSIRLKSVLMMNALLMEVRQIDN